MESHARHLATNRRATGSMTGHAPHLWPQQLYCQGVRKLPEAILTQNHTSPAPVEEFMDKVESDPRPLEGLTQGGGR